MVNNKLHRLPALVLIFLFTAVLALGLTTAACNDNDKGEDGIVGKLVLTIPIDDGTMDSSKVAPETVQYYQISGYDKDGSNTYYDKFMRDNKNTNDEFTSLTLRKGRDSKGDVTGVTYGTKTLLINYFDGDNAFLGYTLFTDLDLTSKDSKELIVDNVVLKTVAKKYDAISLSLTSDTEAEEAAAKEDGDEDTETFSCVARVDEMLQISAIVDIKVDPANSDKSIAIDTTETGMITFGAPQDDKKEHEGEGDEGVLVPSIDRAGYYRCASVGKSSIEVSYTPLTSTKVMCNVTVYSDEILGTVNVTLTDEFAAELAAKGEVCHAVLKDTAVVYDVTGGNKFTMADIPSITGNPVVNFSDIENNNLGSCIIPDVIFSENGEVVEITVP